MSAGATRSSMPTERLDSQYLQSLFQGAGFGIVACGPTGEVVSYNAAAAKLFDERRGIEIGAHAAELFPEGERMRSRELLRTCIQHLASVEMRTQLFGVSIDAPEYAVWFTPVLDPDGSLRGVCLWFRDVSAQVHVEPILAKREKLASLGALSGAVAHHYNNLICSIATSVEYAINMNTISAMRRALQRTASAVGRAAHITRQLLAFAQADHSEGDLADLTETVLYYFDENERNLTENHVKLVLDWEPCPVYPLPREQLLIVLNHLVENAVDVMEQGGELMVTLKPTEDGENIRLSITDSGGGISAQSMEHLFEPFYTTKGALAAGSSNNAGMGLAVVHGLISEMHGRIAASNVPGRGARFEILFPVQQPPD